MIHCKINWCKSVTTVVVVVWRWSTGGLRWDRCVPTISFGWHLLSRILERLGICGIRRGFFRRGAFGRIIQDWPDGALIGLRSGFRSRHGPSTPRAALRNRAQEKSGLLRSG